MSNDQQGYWGERPATAGSSEYNAMFFTVGQILNGRNVAALVQVVAVDSGGGALAVAGRVDVHPLVNLIDGQGNGLPHGVISGLIYSRIQGGTNAIIMDPEIGDIGVAVFCDRDNSTVIATGAEGNPGSRRRNDMADGVYFGGMLNAVPEQYVRFSPDSIEIVSPTLVRLSAPDVRIDAERIVMEASDSINATAPDMDFNASNRIRLNTPLVETTGNMSVAGLSSLNGGFAALPRAGGGASTISGDVEHTGSWDSTGDVINNGKNIGSPHTHGGVQTGTGNTGGVN